MSYRRPTNGFHASALSRIALAIRPLSCLAPRPALTDHFSTLDPAVWGPSDYNDITGEPQEVSACTIDGRCALKMRSNMSSRERRGIATIRTFDPTKLSVEVDFKPLSGVDGLLELWLIDPGTNAFIGLGVYGADLGLKRQVMSTSSFDDPSEVSCDCWEYGRWYKLLITADGRRTRTSLLNSEGKDVWNHQYPWPLDELGGRFRVNLSQSIGERRSGLWKAEAAVDKVTIVSAAGRSPKMHPVPAN